ncbi:MAG TPA: hypothetical protein VFH73_06395 [Polyangia bacterium]|nr:hypothetical protein [Polyangia bacterium]
MDAGLGWETPVEGSGGSGGQGGEGGTEDAGGTAGGSGGASGTGGAGGSTGTGGAGGSAGMGGAATGGTGGSIDAGPPETPGTGGSGGAPDATPVTGACAGKTRLLAMADSVIANFESGSLVGWYDYRDATANATLNHVAIVMPGGAGSTRAGRLSGNGFQGFGAGMGLGLRCWDASVFHGIVFWAKGTSGTDNNIALQVAIPATHAVADGGDCVARCFDHPSKKVVLGPDWTQYRVTWAELTQAGFGDPASYQGIIMALNWVSISGPALDFSIDEIAFY